MKSFFGNLFTTLGFFKSQSAEPPQATPSAPVLPKGHDIQDWPDAPAMQLMITCDYDRVLNTSTSKSAPLIAALNEVKEHYPHVVFRIAHSRSEKEALKETTAINKLIGSPDHKPFFAAPIAGDQLAASSGVLAMSKSEPGYWKALKKNDFMNNKDEVTSEKQKRFIIHMDNGNRTTGSRVLNTVYGIDDCIPLNTADYQAAAQDLLRYVKHIAATGTSPGI